MCAEKKKTYMDDELKTKLMMIGVAGIYVSCIAINIAFNRGKRVGAKNALKNLDALFPETDISRKWTKYCFEQHI